MKVYLDVCCFNRPFDDQSQSRIRLESEAVLAILSYCNNGQWTLIGSEVIDYEVSQTFDEDRRNKVEVLTEIINFRVVLDESIIKRAKEMQDYGVNSFDSLNIACAEKADVDIFLTTDDDIVKTYSNNVKIFNVKIDNPLSWISEVI